MLQSEPILNPEWTQKPLEVWKKLGPLDFDKINEISPIDLTKDLVYQEKDTPSKKVFYQFKNGKREGLQREIHCLGDHQNQN